MVSTTMSWDLLLAASTTFLMLPAVITLVDDQAHIPRWASGTMIVGLIGVTVALFGFGAVFGATATSVEVGLWGAVFWLRGKK